MRSLAFIAALGILFSCGHAHAAGTTAPTVVERGAAVDRLSALMVEGYVHPEKAAKVAADLSENKKSLVAIQDPVAFAGAVEKRVKAITNDVHFSFEYRPDSTFVDPPAADAGAEVEARDAARRRNYGFKKVELLDGAIGLIEIDQMFRVDSESGAKAAAALALVADAEAIVIDLRNNPGGSGSMNQFISSYFFEDGKVELLIRNVNRKERRDVQEWTQLYVPGSRMPDTPLYFLVNRGTGSAAEGFAYNLQALGRAKVVGQPTAGAAHSGSMESLPGKFVSFVPTGLTVNPKTKGNWEGGGVQPNVLVAADLALEKVQELFWAEQTAKHPAGSPEAERANWALRFARARVNPVVVSPEKLARYVGQYGADRRVFLEGGALFVERNGRSRSRLLPLDDTEFVAIDHLNYGLGNSRFTFETDPSGAVTNLKHRLRHAPMQVATFDNPRNSS